VKVAEAIAHVFKLEGVQQLVCYPRQPLIDACATIGIRPIVCRQERVGAGIADGISRSTYGKSIGVFSMQGGPGIENTFAGVAQVFGDNVPVLFVPGERVGRSHTPPSFDAILNFRHVTKWAAEVSEPERLSELLRRAFHALRSGKPGPVLLEVSSRLTGAEISGGFDYRPVKPVRAGPDRADVTAAAEILLGATCPVIHAGQGVLYAGATKELVAFAELIGAPVLTTNTGKGAFPENHPLSLGASVISAPKAVFHFLAKADCIIGIGTSLTRNVWAPKVPEGKRIIHSTNDPADINKEFPTEAAILGDAKLVLEALIGEIGARRQRNSNDVAKEVQAIKQQWLAEWMPELSSQEVPINQYRIIDELKKALPREQTIVTHDSGSPREQLVAFWECLEPGGYLGWGKTTQLGHGLGLIMGAKLAHPDKICINVMGDASIGMVGMDIETAVRNRIGILTIVFNNGVMAGEQNSMQAAVERYQAANLGGNYSEVARALGAWSARVTEPDAFRPALDRALEATQSNVPALIECVAKQNYKYSRY
jgi:acetolactate synthase I/II/III large subunit